MKEGLEKEISTDPRNPYNVAFRRMGELYRQYLRHEFDANKKGGRKWRAVKKSTLKWRERKYGIKHKLILFVTHTLHNLTHTKFSAAKGHYEKRTKYGITIGVAPAIPHPDYPGSIYAAVAFHAKGLPKRKIPPRPIFVPASQQVKDKMDRSMKLAHAKVTKEANRAINDRKPN